MSQITDFYLSWLGNASFGGSSIRLRDQEPIVFRPTDISGCAIWMDANDNDAVVYNSFLEVLSWTNKGYLGGQFDISGTQAVQYGTTTVNGLNTVTFTENAFMSGVFAMNFQERSVFFVTKENTDLSGGIPNPWISSDTTGGMETFSLRNGTFTYFLGKHPSPIPELAFETPTDYLGVPTLVEFINSTDISNNWMGINGQRYPSVYDTAASGYNTSAITYFLGGYFGGSPIPSNQDVCEIIIYNTALSDPDRQNVEAYLRRKWNLAEPVPPPTPPPGPFVPTDISGLSVWMDASNLSTFTLSGTDVTSWSNLGSAGSAFNAGCNIVSRVTDKNGTSEVEFPVQATLEGVMTNNYYSRTAFAVFQNLSILDTITYPYINLISSTDLGARQIGVNYDSGNSNYQITLCQQAYNCPNVGTFALLGTGDRSLAIYVVDSNSSSNSPCYFNGGSNINVSTDVGNLFNTGSVNYFMGSGFVDSPNFKVGEILEYDNVLNSGQISTVANYLVTKWAISSFVPLS